jgi:hypothetical protein
MTSVQARTGRQDRSDGCKFSRPGGELPIVVIRRNAGRPPPRPAAAPLLHDSLLLLLLAAGIVLRFAYTWHLSRQGLPNAASEAWQVAVHLAHAQGFAGAYRFGDLPTAHMLPIPPAIAGGVYAVLGVSSPAAEFVLLAWSTALAIGSFVLFDRAFAMLGTPRRARLLALAALLFANPYISQEVVEFRVWDGGLASFLSAACLVMLLQIKQKNQVKIRAVANLVALNALLFFVNPILGVAAYCCTGLVILTRLSIRRFAIVSGIAVLALAVLIVPWTLRNERIMGKGIPLRSNAGLELAISMYPGAEQPVGSPADRFADRLRAIHPQDGREGFDAMVRAGGEVPYATALGQASIRWIVTHPATAARVVGSHIRQVLLPPVWLFDISSTNHTGSVVKSLLACLASIAGLPGIALALARRRPSWIFVALLVAVPTLLISPFQPIARYIYLIFPPLVFAGADLLAAVAAMTGLRVFSRADRAPNRPDRQAA